VEQAAVALPLTTICLGRWIRSGGPWRNGQEARDATLDDGGLKNLSASDRIKTLLDFFQKDMLYRIDSVLIRRFDRSPVQPAGDAT